MKSKIIYFILTLFLLIILICSINTEIAEYISTAFTMVVNDIFKNADVNSVYDIINFIGVFFMYFSIASLFMLIFSNHFDKIINVLLYSILASLAVGVISMAIKSFGATNIWNSLVPLLTGIGAGIIMVFVIKVIATRKQNKTR